ncbi:MAG: hypothetical protein RMY29_017265 [Nostoc sp. CreGUA01]|nr:hypothetical protein [Nostoc sp. CreGUA01]
MSEGSGGGDGLPPSKSVMTVAEPGKNSRILNFEFVDDAQVPGGFKEYRGKGADFPEKFNRRKQAQKLADDPLALIKASKLDLQLRIDNINSALKNGDYAKAQKLINKSIQEYGYDPQLMLSKAAVEQHLGRLKIEKITPESATPIKNNFFDEINNRNFRRIETDTEFRYVQDSPSLSNLDTTKPITESVSSGSGFRLYKLQPGKVGAVPINQSGFGDVSASSHPSTQFQGTNIANSLKYRYRDYKSNNECNNQPDEEENQNPNCSLENLEKPVYVVTE